MVLAKTRGRAQARLASFLPFEPEPQYIYGYEGGGSCGFVERKADESTQYKSQRFRPGEAQIAIFASLDSGPPTYHTDTSSQTRTPSNKGLSTILKLPVEKGGCSMHVDVQVYDFEADALTSNADGGRDARSTLTLPPESAIQYYRASSVVLGTPPPKCRSCTSQYDDAAAVPIINPELTPIVEPYRSTSNLWSVGVMVGVGVGGTILLWVCIKQRPRVVFPEILPDCAREPMDTPSLSYSIAERESDARVLTQTLLLHRRADSRVEGEEELPPPSYSPAAMMPPSSDDHDLLLHEH
ncbi:hypothetical protein CPB86DRAFT_824951 [Serendipita vermifera]|nr:hypothetical protein CPB86DRAFT_824951 [Serendipita vermifera]